MNHTEILNSLAEKHRLQTYLEIGVQNPKSNFDRIKCPIKIGVDPEPTGEPESGLIHKMASDEFFEVSPMTTEKNFDLIFIDGLHHAEQVKKDFENSLKRLNPGGFIVIHDCNPTDEAWTVRPRGDQKVWTGDVYKFAVTIPYDGDLEVYTVDTDFGVMVVRRLEPGYIKTPHYSELPCGEITWDWFSNNKNVLHLITPKQFKEIYL